MKKVFVTGYHALHGNLSRLEDATPVYALSEENERVVQDTPKFLKKISSLYPRFDRVTQLALTVARQCLEKFASSSVDFLPGPSAVIVGSARGATSLLERAIVDHYRGDKISALTSPLTTAGGIASTVSHACELDSLALGTSMACTSFFESLMVAQSLIACGRIKRALVIGTEAPLTQFTIAQMKRLKLYSRDTKSDFPCRPFESIAENVNHLVLGEGAACFLIEGEESLDVSKHPPLVEVLGFGMFQELDASLTGMDHEGIGFELAMKQALSEAQIKLPEFIIAHAPGTVVGDSAEHYALQSFNEVPILSTKYYTGHTFGASAALSLACGCDIVGGKPYPIIPFDGVMKNRVVRPGQRQRDQQQTFLVNAAGFGGVVMSAVFSKAF